VSPAKSRSSFDRLRPRTASLTPPAATTGADVDTEGKRALFSTAAPRPATGSVVVECSLCGVATVLSARQAVRAALPSLHLPLVKREFSSWMRCPACSRRTWVRLRFRH
jgi:uncharacterized protein with PIN domain